MKKTKTIIIISCLVGLFGFLMVVSMPIIWIFENEKRDSNSSQILIENKTNTNITAVICAVPLSEKIHVKDANASKYPLPQNNSMWESRIMSIIGGESWLPRNYLSDAKTEIYRIPPDSNEFIFYYYGDREDANDVLVSVTVWKGTNVNEAEIMESPPYLVRSFYNPEPLYMTSGEREYGRIYNVIVEDK